MKTIVKGSIQPRREVRLLLDAIAPTNSVSGAYYDFQFALDDARLQKVLDVLNTAGYKPWIDRSRMPQDRVEYQLEYIRIYDDADYAVAELLELRPTHWFTRVREGPGIGPLVIDEKEIRAGVDFAFGSASGWFYASETVRQAVEQSDLIGFLFHETVLYTKKDRKLVRKNWSEAGKHPWWELDSKIILPRLSKTMQLRNRHGQPTDGSDRVDGCKRFEELYRDPELHYRRKDLKEIPMFDIARTWEAFGERELRDADRGLVFSAKFYRFCVEQGWKANWMPVRIED